MKTNQEIEAANRFMSYRRGWIDGACGRAENSTFTEHRNEAMRAAYAVGYDHAVVAFNAAIRNAQDVYGYESSVLRVEEGGER